MGTVVPFPPRKADAALKAEAILAQIGELYRRRTRAREELPGVLAELADAGQTETVLKAIRLWGSGDMPAEEVLELCRMSLRQRPSEPGPNS